MPSRYYRRNYIKGYFYHIYNRGANKGNVFLDAEDYGTFIQILAYYLVFPLGKPLSILNRLKNKVPNLVEDANYESGLKLCVYCIMPNHFHLLIKQDRTPTKTGNVTNLMRRLVIAYAMYFTKKYDHSGTLFQGKFKNILVDSDSQLIQLSKYIHRNPLEKQGSEPLHKYKYSSCRFYIGDIDEPSWLDTHEVLNLFQKSNPKSNYKKFTEEEGQDLPNSLTLE
jgi:putative transposase